MTGVQTCALPICRAAAVIVLVLAVGECVNRPMWIAPADSWATPDVYKVIRNAAPGAVVELPMPDLGALPGLDPMFESWSLWHWKPLINGYSGYYPPDYVRTIVSMAAFPDGPSIERLRAHDVRYVVVHRASYVQEDYANLLVRMAARPEFRTWGSFRAPGGMADIFELTP